MTRNQRLVLLKNPNGGRRSAVRGRSTKPLYHFTLWTPILQWAHITRWFPPLWWWRLWHHLWRLHLPSDTKTFSTPPPILPIWVIYHRLILNSMTSCLSLKPSMWSPVIWRNRDGTSTMTENSNEIDGKDEKRKATLIRNRESAQVLR